MYNINKRKRIRQPKTFVLLYDLNNTTISSSQLTPILPYYLFAVIANPNTLAYNKFYEIEFYFLGNSLKWIIPETSFLIPQPAYH
jgi:hypothetical protein